MTGKVAVQPIIGAAPAEALHDQVAAMTHRLFRGQVSIRLECDPELPLEYFVVNAEVAGEVDEIVELCHQWHSELRKVACDQANDYRLSFHFA